MKKEKKKKCSAPEKREHQSHKTIIQQVHCSAPLQITYVLFYFKSNCTHRDYLRQKILFKSRTEISKYFDLYCFYCQELNIFGSTKEKNTLKLNGSELQERVIQQKRTWPLQESRKVSQVQNTDHGLKMQLRPVQVIITNQVVFTKLSMKLISLKHYNSIQIQLHPNKLWKKFISRSVFSLLIHLMYKKGPQKSFLSI